MNPSPDPSLSPAARATGAGTTERRAPRAPAAARTAALGIAFAAIVLVLLGWASGVSPGSPFEPAQRLRRVGSDFRIVMGAGLESGRRLAIGAVGAERMALQSHVFAQPLDAGRFPLLRYRWDNFPRTLELSFVFRRTDHPDDVQTISLPPAGAHPGYFDLRDVPAWHGSISEIGFAEFPTAQLVPTDIAFRPFALSEVELWSPSWRGSLGALLTDWTAYRPWSLMSVSALGPDAPWPHKPTPVVVLSGALLAGVALTALLLGRGRRWLGMAAAVALACGWVALDLRWLGEFADRHLLTRQLYAGKPWRERAAIEPDTELVASAARVRAVLERMPAHSHVLVAADSVYDTLRLDYHLLPANVAPAGALAMQDPGRPLPASLLVVYADAGWTFDAARGVLAYAGRRYAAKSMLEAGEVRVFRLQGEAK
jgi:hypothetical protein